MAQFKVLQSQCSIVGKSDRVYSGEIGLTPHSSTWSLLCHLGPVTVFSELSQFHLVYNISVWGLERKKIVRILKVQKSEFKKTLIYFLLKPKWLGLRLLEGSPPTILSSFLPYKPCFLCPIFRSEVDGSKRQGLFYGCTSSVKFPSSWGLLYTFSSPF